jgi:hypothetical protein
MPYRICSFSSKVDDKVSKYLSSQLFTRHHFPPEQRFETQSLDTSDLIIASHKPLEPTVHRFEKPAPPAETEREQLVFLVFYELFQNTP